MKKFFKIILEIILVLTIIALILVFLSFSAKSEIVPDIYVTSDSGKVALAIKGGYTWNSFSESKVVDSIAPEDYVYMNNNTLLVTPGEKMTFKNSDNPLNCYKFYQLEMQYNDDEANEIVNVPAVEDSKTYADLKYLEINAPENEGTYIYNFKFSYYNKGEVSYGLKVVVSTEPNYEIDNLIDYRNTNIIDADTINNILELLPYSRYKTGIILKTGSDNKGLIINYEEFVVDREDLINNIIALFTLIPELDVITYKSNDEIYNYTREEIENQIGRCLTDYSEDIELWKKEILFKEKVMDEKTTRDTIYKAIIDDIFLKLGEIEIKEIYLDTKSFKEGQNLEISEVDRQEILEYASNFATVVYDMSYNDYKKSISKEIFIGLVEMKDKTSFIKDEASGDIESTITNNNANVDKNIKDQNNVDIENDIIDYISGDYESSNDKYICTVLFSQNNRSKLYTYEVEFTKEGWKIKEL